MFDDFKEWVELTLANNYAYTQGQWVENSANADTRICVIHSTGGAAPDVEDRRPRFKVILIGKRDNRGDVQQIKTDIYALAQAAMGDSRPCGAASVRATGETVGPGYTTEDRAWFQLDFQLIY